jgi:hypothetical protein
MELWVRSQDKEILLKVNELEIEANMIIAFDNSKYQCLGTYKTKERALEVLDEIQDLMRSLSDSDLKIIQYEMPQE